MGTLPLMALLPGVRPIKVATPWVLVPKGVRPPATSHQPLAQWTRRHLRPVTGHWSLPVTSHRSPATGQMGITQEFSSQSITGQWPSSYRSLDLENINTGKSIFTGQRSPVIEIYINLQLGKLMPWAWSSLIIINYPWNQTLIICLIQWR